MKTKIIKKCFILINTDYNTAVTSDLIVSEFLNQNVEPTVTNEVELVNSSHDDTLNNNNVITNSMDHEYFSTYDNTNLTIIRSVTRKRQEKNAEKQCKKHDRKRNKITHTFKVGDYVSVQSPRIDRHGTDLPRIAAIVIRLCNQSGTTYYELQTKFGILDVKYRVDDLEPIYTPIIDLTAEEIPKKLISLREATISTNTTSSSTNINTKLSCQCNNSCYKDKRCKCFKNNQVCTSHCHGKSKVNVCCNKEGMNDER